MYSPFHTAEQKRLYPHRNISINSKKDAIEYYNDLIKKGILSKENVSKKTIGELKHDYTPNCDPFTIVEALFYIGKND
jgi:hypothetical protein